MSAWTAPPAIDHDPGTWEPIILTVRVMPRHVAEGKPALCADCPIALAILEALGNAQVKLADGAPVRVYGSHVDVTTRDGRWYFAHLPQRARMFIVHFDHYDGPAEEPFTFHLELERVVPRQEF